MKGFLAVTAFGILLASGPLTACSDEECGNPQMGVTCKSDNTATRHTTTTTRQYPVVTPPSAAPSTPSSHPTTASRSTVIATTATTTRPVPTTAAPIAPTTTAAPSAVPAPKVLTAQTSGPLIHSSGTPVYMNGPVVQLFGTTARLISNGPNGGPRLSFGGASNYNFQGAVIQLQGQADFMGYRANLDGGIIGAKPGQSLDFDIDPTGLSHAITVIYLG